MKHVTIIVMGCLLALALSWALTEQPMVMYHCEYINNHPNRARAMNSTRQVDAGSLKPLD